MQQELIKTTGAVAGQVAASALKNTTCTISLSGAAAAFTVLGSVGMICGTVIAVVCIANSQNQKDQKTISSYDV